MQYSDECRKHSDRRTSASAGIAAVLLTFALVFLFAGQAAAQLDTALISGTVRDQSGALIPGATVQVHNQDTGLLRTTITGGSGTYQMGQIPPGVYTIEAQAQGFSSSIQQNATLALSQALVFNFTLQVGSAASTVEVSASAVSLDTASATLGLTISSQTVTELPLNGNNYTQELLLMPGATGVNRDQTGAEPTLWEQLSSLRLTALPTAATHITSTA